jgi:hypothetical protein
MIQFGASTIPPTAPSCTSAPLFGISVQDLMLSGNSQDVIGILNECSQETTFVNRVNFYEITGTSLYITGAQAQNSGPYSNITCNPGPVGGSFTTSTVCVNINGTGDLRGVHGLTATVGSDGCTSTCPASAVLLDSSSTTIEDAHFEGFATGILVGANANAKGDVIFNVSGGGSTLTGPTTNVIEISSNASDLSIMGVTAGTNPSSPNPNSIDDTLTGSTLADAHVALYAIGESLGGSYSRFTTSTNTSNTSPAPTWGSGSLGAGTNPSAGCVGGSLFSNVNGGAGHTLFVCIAGAWTDIK